MSWGYRAGGKTLAESLYENNKLEITQEDNTKVYRTYGYNRGIKQYELIVFLRNSNNSSCVIKSKVFNVFIRIDSIPNFMSMKELYNNIVQKMENKYTGVYKYNDLKI